MRRENYFVFINSKTESNMTRVVLRHKIAFDMEVQGIKQLKSAFSDAFVIRGLKWKIEIKKQIACQKKNRMEDTVAVWLHCNFPKDFEEYMCGAQAKITLVSFKDNRKSHQACISSVHESKDSPHGLESFIEWKKLFTDGYVRDDTVLFEIELKVGRLEHNDCGSLIITTIEDKFKGETETEKLMKLILNNVDNDFVAAKSAKFKFNDVIWYTECVKWFDGEKDIFEIRLRCDGGKSPANWLCELSAKLKLMAENADSEPVEECHSFDFADSDDLLLIEIIEWSKLKEQFVKNGTVEMVLELKVENPTTAD